MSEDKNWIVCSCGTCGEDFVIYKDTWVYKDTWEKRYLIVVGDTK